MRLGAHAFLWVGEASTEPIVYAVGQAADEGLEFVEIPILRPKEIHPARISSALRKHGLGCTCSLVLPPEAALPENPRGAMAFLLQAVDVAASLGSPIVTGVVYSALGTTTPPTPQTLETVATVLKHVAQAAAARGVRIGVEPVNRYETSLVNTAEQALKLITAIQEPNVFLHLDTYHMNIEERGFRQAILRAGKQLQYLHLSESHRGEPGTGTVGWEEVFAALAEVGFDGDLALEAFLAPSAALAQATRIWTPHPIEPRAVVRAGRTLVQWLAKAHGLPPPAPPTPPQGGGPPAEARARIRPVQPERRAHTTPHR
ncbi:MAG: sugar phosphate isomerase/epimerase [Candidatus Bipolaricaulota bacterium]|nr:sugar phosphate isomerase/epimerase [Candidatus Bipolaricaulota bacterium]